MFELMKDKAFCKHNQKLILLQMTAAESFIILKTKLTDDFDTDSVNDHDFLANLKPFGA